MLLLLVVVFNSLYAQNSSVAMQIKADKYYSTLNYAKAIPFYEVLAKQPQPEPTILIKLAHCYRMVNNNEKALSNYQKLLMTTSNVNPIYKYYYAKALMSKGDYKNALDMFKKYIDIDQRNENFAKFISNIQMYYIDSSKYKITKTTFNSSYNDFSPFILENDKIVFVSSRPTAKLVNYIHGWTNKQYLRIFYTEKNKKGNYKKPKLFSNKIQNRFNNGPFTFSADLSKIIYTKNNMLYNKPIRSGSGEVKLQLYQSNYDPTKNKYLDLLIFEYGNNNYNFAHPSLSQDGKLLFFSSDKPGGYGGMDIWVSTRQNDKWTEPVNLGPRVNTPGNEVFPYIFNNEKLYFSSDGIGGLGGLDVFEVFVNSSGMPMGVPKNMGANFNSPADDFGVFFRKDGKTGFLSSNREKQGLNDDIYEFEIREPVRNKVIIKGITFDKDTKKTLANTKVLLYDDKENVQDSTYADENGEFTFVADYNVDFSLIGEKENYYKTKSDFTTKNLDANVKEVNLELYLQKADTTFLTENLLPIGTLLEGPFTININVTEGNTFIPLSGVKVKIFNKTTGDSEEFFTNASGQTQKVLYNMKVGDNLDFVINLEKEGYLPRERLFGYTILKANTVNVNESMFKIEKGQDIGIAININPIYFDYDKYDIRPDAKIELDKVVSIMKQYPDIKIELTSHTDCRGSHLYNMALSEKRAKASKDYLVNKGISPNRIIAKGYGETKLVNNCYCGDNDKDSPCSEEEHQKNRRTEFIIIKY